jgi:hypothetical protein
MELAEEMLPRVSRVGARPDDPAVAPAAGGSGDRSMRPAVGSRHTTTVPPAGTLHQPSIRAREAAHEVVFDRRRFANRRGWASPSLSRSGATINHPENAHTGTVAVRPTRRSRRLPPRLPRNTGWLEARVPGTAPPAELVVVDVVAGVRPDDLQSLLQRADLRRDRAGPWVNLHFHAVPTLMAAELILTVDTSRA